MESLEQFIRCFWQALVERSLPISNQSIPSGKCSALGSRASSTALKALTTLNSDVKSGLGGVGGQMKEGRSKGPEGGSVAGVE
jgi:hypothetical protein